MLERVKTKPLTSKISVVTTAFPAGKNIWNFYSEKNQRQEKAYMIMWPFIVILKDADVAVLSH